MSSMFSIVLSLMGLGDQVPETEDDRLWGEWLAFEGRPREMRHLKELLGSCMRDTFKERAIIILLAPDLNQLPESLWPRQDRVLNSYVCSSVIDCSVLSPRLVEFAARNVIGWVQGLKRAFEKDDGEGYVKLLERYNPLIRELLGYLPHTSMLARELFVLYELRTYACYPDIEECSGYEPFRMLLYAQRVPDVWKATADVKMRERVTDEIMGRKQPREKWEDALRQYIEIVCFLAGCEGKSRYDDDLLAGQIEFLLSLEQVKKIGFMGYNVSRIMSRLTDDRYHSLRMRFMHMQVFAKPESDFAEFHVRSWRDLILCKRQLEEIEDESSVLAVRLRELIEQGEGWLARQNAHKDEKKVALEDLLARMS